MSLDTEPTNLERLQKDFHYLKWTYNASNDNYESRRYTIEWLGEGEHFVLMENMEDRDVGAVWFEDLCTGTMEECLIRIKTLENKEIYLRDKS